MITVYPTPTPTKEFVAQSLAEFVEIISRISDPKKPQHNWIFRGQQCAGWQLIPSIMRHFPDGNQLGSKEINETERSMLGSFIRQARPTIASPPPDAHRLEWLAMAQHHFLPTRLLDWAEHAAAALYFAVEHQRMPKRNGHQEEFSSVWCSEKLTHLRYGIAHDEINNIYMYEPPHSDPRITMQRGCFTIHPSDYLETEYRWPKPLIHIKIPSKSRTEIRRTLRTMGIHKATLFPDLDGVCSEIRRREGFRA